MGFENNLFDEKYLLEIVKNIEVSQKEKEFIKSWICDLENKKLEKEKENYDNFQKNFLEKIFGFELLKNLSRDKKMENKMKEVEFCFTDENNKIVSFIELKGFKTKNLFGIESGRNTRPPEQAYLYSQYIKGKIYFVSNYGDFLIFDKTQTIKKFLKLNFLEFEEKNFLQFKLLKFFLNKNFIFNQNEKKIEYIKIDTKKQDISKEFYSLYRETLFSLVEKILCENEIKRIKAVEISQIILNRIIFICFARDKNFLDNGFLQNKILNSIKDEKNIWKNFEETFDLLYSGIRNELEDKWKIPNFNGSFFKKISYVINLKNEDNEEEEKIFEKIPKAKISKKILLEYKKHEVELKNISSVFQNFFKICLYNFQSDLNVNILGHIFENSLNDIENLKSEKINIRKKDGIFYTPEYITEYICRNTIISYLSKTNKNNVDDLILEYEEIEDLEKKLKNIKILDPACGSGAFLNKAVDILIEIWERVLNEKDLDIREVSGKHRRKNTTGKVFTLETDNLKHFEKRANIKKIIKNNIFGVDLNNESVEISKLSLHLKTLQKKNPKLENLEKNIKCGNSLISGINENNFKDFEDDLKKILLEKDKEEKKFLIKSLNRKINNNLKEYFGEDYKNVKPFNWEVEFIEIFFKINESGKLERKGFDVVIGNPPYVDIKKLKNNMIKYFFKKYVTCENRINLYSIFIERGYNLIINNGLLSFINPNSMLINSSYRKLRRLLIDDLIFLIKLPDKIFENVNVETIIFILQKKSNKNILKIIKYGRNDIIKIIDNKKIKKIKKENWKKNKEISFNLYLNFNRDSILEKINKNKNKLTDLADFSLGITPYDKYKGHSEDLIKNKDFHSNKKIDAEYKPLIKGENIVRFFIKKQIVRYIKYGNWLGAKREEKFFTDERLIIRQIISGNPPRIYVGLTNKPLYFTQIGFGIISKDNKKISNKYLLILLNSNLINFYHKYSFLDLEKNIFQKILIANCKKIPIPEISKTEQIPFIEKAEKMLELNKNFYDKINFYLENLKIDFEVEKISKKLEKFYLLEINEFLKEIKKISNKKIIEEFYNEFENKKNEILEIKNEIDLEDLEINKMVYEIYGLTNEEIEIVENG